MVKNLLANAGDMGWISDLGRFHMTAGNQARVPQLLSPCPATREATAMRSQCTATRKQSLLFTTREKPVHSNEHPAQPKIN